MVLPFLTLYLTLERRLPASRAGLVLTIYGVGSIVIAPLAGRLTDRLGGLLIIKLSLFSTGVILFIFPFVDSLVGIFAITGIWAIANEAFRPPSMAIIGDLAGPEHRKAAFALNRLAINLGMSIGPVLGGFLATRSFKLLFYVDGATALLAGLLVTLLPWRAVNANRPETDGTRGLNAAGSSNARSVVPYSLVLNDRRFLYFLIAMIPIEIVFFQPLAAMALYLVRDLHFTEATFGAILAVNTVIIIFVEVPLNSAMANWPHRHALALGALLVGAGFGALIFVNGIIVAAATIVVWTFGEMIILPASSAYVSDVAPREQAGAYMGLYTMGFSVAFAIGPWMGTKLLDDFGAVAVWTATFLCGCVTAALVWFLPDTRAQSSSPPLWGRD